MYYVNGVHLDCKVIFINFDITETFDLFNVSFVLDQANKVLR